MGYITRGYKHYWRFRPQVFDGTVSPINTAKYDQVLRDCRNILLASCNKMDLAIELDSTGGGIRVNGIGEEGHECFVLEPQLDQNDPFNYCKTDRKPYDTVVTACIIVLTSYMGSELVQVLSDGGAEDWQAGLALARSVLQQDSFEIPASVMSGPVAIVPRPWLAAASRVARKRAGM